MRKTDLVALTALVSTTALTALLFTRLPPVVATHFDLSGTPNGSMSRLAFALFCPTLALGLWLFHRLVVARRSGKHRTSLPVTGGTAGAVGERMLLLQLFVVLGVHVLLLRNSIVPERGVVTLSVSLLLGAISLAFALWLPRVRPNPYIGVRVPWTRESPTVWAKTHRFAGYTYFTAFVGCVVALFVPHGSAPTLALTCFLMATFAPVIYAFWLARAEARGPHR